MRFIDTVAVAGVGLSSRRGRTALTALGIAIGIAAMVSVIGISASSRADLINQLDRLGTNLLQVTPGQSFLGDDSKLPVDAAKMIRRVGPVADAAATRSVSATVRRSDKIPASETGGIAVIAAEPNLASVLQATVRHGAFLNRATARYPAVVLGSVSASRLGITSLKEQPAVWLGNRWFTVVGILNEVPLAPDIDRSVMIGFDVAERLYGLDPSASTVRVRTDPAFTEAVREVLPATANPESPNEVRVTRPSDALEARTRANNALTNLLLALGAVALVVGGVGIANVMVISVLERRTEIGLRRALGATRRHVRLQFLVEALMLAGAGGVGGVLLGALSTAIYATARGWSVSVPVRGLAGGVAAALLIGAIAGLYPAGRAARLAPADAVRPA